MGEEGREREREQEKIRSINEQKRVREEFHVFISKKKREGFE